MYVLQVEGMTCGHCVSAVTRSIQSVDAGATVDVDLQGKKVHISSNAPLEDIKAAVNDAGYEVMSGTAV